MRVFLYNKNIMSTENNGTPAQQSPFTSQALSRGKKGITTVGLDANLSDQVLIDLEEAFAVGATDKIACAYAGISEWTYRQWRSYADMNVEPYATAIRQLQKVLAQVAINDLKHIGHHAKTQWRAAAFRLERRFPTEYGSKSEITVGSKMQMELVDLVATGIISVEDVYAQLPHLPPAVKSALEPYRDMSKVGNTILEGEVIQNE